MKKHEEIQNDIDKVKDVIREHEDKLEQLTTELENYMKNNLNYGERLIDYIDGKFASDEVEDYMPNRDDLKNFYILFDRMDYNYGWMRHKEYDPLDLFMDDNDTVYNVLTGYSSQKVEVEVVKKLNKEKLITYFSQRGEEETIQIKALCEMCDQNLGSFKIDW